MNISKLGWAKITTKHRVHFLGRVLRAAKHEDFPKLLSLQPNLDKTTFTLTGEDSSRRFSAKGFLPRAAKEWNKLPLEMRKLSCHLELREKMISDEVKEHSNEVKSLSSSQPSFLFAKPRARQLLGQTESH